MRAGVALRPETSLSVVLPLLRPRRLVHCVDVLAVQPGFGGQVFDSGVLTKVQELRSTCPELDIQVFVCVSACVYVVCVVYVCVCLSVVVTYKKKTCRSLLGTFYTFYTSPNSTLLLLLILQLMQLIHTRGASGNRSTTYLLFPQNRG